jgi:hypothetical protein
MSRLYRTPPLFVRLIAGLCAALVLALAVLAACPAAHKWVHGHCGCATQGANTRGTFGRLLNVLGANPQARTWIQNYGGCAAQGTNTGGTHNHNAADPDDDGCIVTLFAHGVVSATVFGALAVAFFRLIAVTAQPREILRPPAPRYWLPPLCGPPQS